MGLVSGAGRQGHLAGKCLYRIHRGFDKSTAGISLVQVRSGAERRRYFYSGGCGSNSQFNVSKSTNVRFSGPLLVTDILSRRVSIGPDRAMRSNGTEDGIEPKKDR